MFGPRIFRSRWAALLWAGGMIWTAYDVVGASAPDASPAKDNAAAAVDATGMPVDPAALAVLANAG